MEGDMSADMPERPDMSDDLARAYAQAHELADDGRGPSATVRANVLAAAREVTAEAAARAAAEAAATRPPTLVAPPVADVGRGRSKAINLSSWRVRSGAALAAMLLAGLAGWRFDAARRFDDGERVAMAEPRMATPPTSRVPQELPLPALSGASSPDLPPPVVADPADGAQRPVAKAAKPARAKDVIVAQVDQRSERTARAAPPVALADARQPQPPATPAPAAPAAAAPPAPVVTASEAPETDASAQEPVTVTARAAPQGETTVAAADTGPQRADVEASRAAYASAGVGDALKKPAPSAVGSLMAAGARVLPPPLHAAADRGDVETLKRLLANPSTPVDAPDATGRTALLHAVLAQQAGAVRLLLAAGADPARADQAGLTPREAARTGASAEIATLLAGPR
jgi:hypothetical protein